MVIDFDSNEWMAELEAALGEHITPDIKRRMHERSFEYSDDALDVLASMSDAEGIIDATLAFIVANKVRIYHGTRLTDIEAEELRAMGLRPLLITERLQWLRERFPEIDEAIPPSLAEQIVRRQQMKHREHQVHAAISRMSMMSDYDYLFEGSEFDRRLVQFAGRDDLVGLLRGRGKPRLIKLAIPGQAALDAMHPFFSIEFTRQNDRYPNLVRQMLREYAWRLHTSNAKRCPVDACLLFRAAVPGVFVEDIETFEDCELPEPDHDARTSFPCSL